MRELHMEFVWEFAYAARQIVSADFLRNIESDAFDGLVTMTCDRLRLVRLRLTCCEA
jgi:hypothetical protein